MYKYSWLATFLCLVTNSSHISCLSRGRVSSSCVYLTFLSGKPGKTGDDAADSAQGLREPNMGGDVDVSSLSPVQNASLGGIAGTIEVLEPARAPR